MELAVVFVLYKFWTKLSHTTCPIQHYSPIRMVRNNPVCKTRMKQVRCTMLSKSIRNEVIKSMCY